MKYLTLMLAVAAFITGLLAAWYWYKASRAQPDPGWDGERLAEPVIHSMAQDAWIVALMQSASESARLNKIAALWTAVAVALNALAALIAFIV